MRTPERAGDLRGVLSLEFALVVVGVLGALMLLGAAWRLGQTRGEMRDVAAEAARAASLLQNPRSAAAAAEKTAQETLGRSGIRCSNFSVAADVSALRPGGSVPSRFAASAGSKISRCCACPDRCPCRRRPSRWSISAVEEPDGSAEGLGERAAPGR